MKLSTASADLLAQLQSVSRVASTRSAVQALAGVQLAASSSGVELRATDMEISLRVPLLADVDRDGSVVLPARLLLDVARSLPKSATQVSLELRPEQQDVEVVAGHAKFHLRGGTCTWTRAVARSTTTTRTATARSTSPGP